MSAGNWFYLFILLNLFVVSMITIKSAPPTREISSYLFAALISLAIGFRSFDSGTDTPAYINYFHNIQNNSGDFEIGFELLTKALNNIGSHRIYLFSICLLTFFFLLISAKSTKTNQLITLLSMLSFVHGFDLLTNGIRNGLGTSFTIAIIVVMISHRGHGPISFLAPALGGFIHLSSFVFPLLTAITQKFLTSKRALWCLYITAIGSLIVTNEFAIDAILNFATPYVDGTGFLNKAARYVLLDQEILDVRIKYYFLVTSSFIAFIILHFYDLISNKSTKLMAGIGILGFSASTFLFFSAFSYRFFILFFIPQILAYTHIFGLKITPIRWKIIMTIFVLTNFLITYSTNSFIKMNLLDI